MISRFPAWSFIAALIFVLGVPVESVNAEVTIKADALVVDGTPFVPRGASGRIKLAELKALGANTVRTYGEESDDVIAQAERLGLKVILGFWLEHPRRGFDYGDRAAVEAQLSRLRVTVLRHKNSPALLMWGLGNEVEAELSDDTQVWPAIEEAARLVKSLDSNHPTMAVLAETGTDKVRKVITMAPHIDVLGINSYGDAIPSVHERVRAQGWQGPIVLTELGAAGQWQTGTAPWGAALEPTSTAKAANLRRYLHDSNQRGLGQILFFWGQKQEVTPTFHSLLLPGGEWIEASEVMAETWNGTTPGGNHAPRISSLAFSGANIWAQASPGTATVAAHDPDDDTLAFQWQIMAESTDLRKAGDAESVPADHSGTLRGNSASTVEIPHLAPGNYRLFVTVRDGRGAAATGNLPFQVQ